RPRLLERLVTDGRGPVLYLDPSVHVLATVDDQILSVISRTPLVLAPKALRPLPDDGLRPTQEELLSAGVYDAGFVAVATGAESFLSSWAAAVRHAPKTAASFLVGAPALVEHHVLRDPGIGLSIWNAAGRQLTKDDTDVMHADGTVLRTVHFSGFDPQRPWLLSAEVAERPRALLSEHPLLAELCATYRGELVRQGGSRQRQAYRFARLEDGTVLPDGLREEYHQAFVDAERTGTDTPPAAFGPQWKGFLRWGAEPVEGLPHSTRWTAALWRDDPALQEQFPDPFAVDATAFREWCAGPGVMSGRVHRDVVPPRADLGAALLDQLGVCVLGTGWMADLVAATARASGVPTSTEPGYPVVLGCGDLTEVPGERYVVAVRIGPCSGADLAGADELWVTSESSRAAHDRVTAIPVRTIALPMLDRPVREDKARASARSANGLANEVVFVTVVDYATERVSNPLGVVSAFLAAFPDRGDVVLLLVVSGFTDNPEAAERLRLATATDPRIRLIEQPTSVPFLIDAADWLVSLHRGDGAGADSIAWWLADTAVRGVPVITSAHGSAVEVFDEETAVLVPCRQGGSEPDIQVAARLLREVAGDPDIADRVARAARWHLLRAYALTRVAEQLREHVEHAYRTWRSRRSAQRPTRDADPLGPLHSARHALLRQPDVGASSKVPMAPALRKAVLRVLSHYDSHLRDVLGTVLDGMERTAAELLNRQEEIRDSGGLGELTNLRAQLDKL
ncbi:MAG: FkbM family methyltransferase, partial [Kutzneria sp.]|nr:FkbM family methyltransferase [Kutzneria sp.]